jgi:hypothetical protein
MVAGDPIWACGEAFGGRLVVLGEQAWLSRGWMNTPGPVYTSDADFAFLGPSLGPKMVAVDQSQMDVVYRQPASLDDLKELELVAETDPFGGYAMDGNLRWTPDLVRAWWARRQEIVLHIERSVLCEAWYISNGIWKIMEPIGLSWLEYLNGDCRGYLKKYIFFLIHRRWPDMEARLPDVD